MKTLRLSLVCVTFLISQFARAEAYGSGWYGETQVTYQYEDNIARTYLNDKTSDTIASVSVGGGYATKVANNAQLVLSSYLFTNQNRDIRDLSHHGLSLGLSYTIQPKPAYAAPWYNITLSATDITYKGSNNREGIRLASEVSANKRLTTELNGSLGFRYLDVANTGDSAFNGSNGEIFLGISYYLSPGRFLYAEIGRRHGDVISTVSGGLRTNFDYDAVSLDTVYDPTCRNGCGFAYRQSGDTNLVTIGMTFPLANLGFDLSINHTEATGDNRRTYRDTSVKLGLLYNF